MDPKSISTLTFKDIFHIILYWWKPAAALAVIASTTFAISLLNQPPQYEAKSSAVA